MGYADDIAPAESVDDLRGVFWRKLVGVVGLVVLVALACGLAAAGSFAALDPQTAVAVTGMS